MAKGNLSASENFFRIPDSQFRQFLFRLSHMKTCISFLESDLDIALDLDLAFSKISNYFTLSSLHSEKSTIIGSLDWKND